MEMIAALKTASQNMKAFSRYEEAYKTMVFRDDVTMQSQQDSCVYPTCSVQLNCCISQYAHQEQAYWYPIIKYQVNLFIFTIIKLITQKCKKCLHAKLYLYSFRLWQCFKIFDQQQGKTCIKYNFSCLSTQTHFPMTNSVISKFIISQGPLMTSTRIDLAQGRMNYHSRCI